MRGGSDRFFEGVIYSTEVHTSFTASPGYPFHNSLFFVINYRLYRQPQGLLRFPDGGMSRTVAEGVFLMEQDGGRLTVRRQIATENVPDADIKLLRGSPENDQLELRIPARIGTQTYFITVTETDVAVHVSDSAEEEPPGVNEEFPSDQAKSITYTSQLLRAEYPAASGLPSPLAYCKKNRKQYIRDVVELKGDLFYRKEIIRTAGFSRDEIRQILARIERRGNSLEGSKGQEYRFIATDTKEELNKAGDVP